MFALPATPAVRPGDATTPTLLLRQVVWDAVHAANGKFVRFLDNLDKADIEVQPRWTMLEGVAPINTFHLEPMRYRTREVTKPKAFGSKPKPVQPLAQALSDDMGWAWLLCHLDYPQEAKERLLELARPGALAWLAKQQSANESMGEKRVREALEWMFAQPFPKVRPAWLTEPGYLHPYELDGFCEGLNLAFEFQGQQHYELVTKFKMTEAALLERQRTDAWKRLKVHDAKVFLIDVHFDDVPPHGTVLDTARTLMHKLNGDATGRRFLDRLVHPEAQALRSALSTPKY